MAEQELKVQQKREMDKEQERTIPARIFVPTTDIFETAGDLKVVLEMPGVNKDSVDVRVENNVLTINGQVDFAKYQGLKPLYTEYNIGNYSRSFRLSSKIRQEAIEADLNDGVITLILPKAEESKPRKIKVE
jgi:HSP20 family protein